MPRQNPRRDSRIMQGPGYYNGLRSSRVLGQVPLTSRIGIRGSEQCISGRGTPNRCPDTDSHAIPQAFVSSEPLVPPMKLLLPPTVPTGLLSFCSSFLTLCLSPAFRKEISHQDRLETTMANSVDPLHPRFVPLH